MKNNRRKAVLLMAGKSERFSKTGVKKQFALLLNKESFLYPLESFISSQLFEEIILVIEEEDRNHIEKILARENLVFPHRFVIGVETDLIDLKALCMVFVVEITQVHDAFRAALSGKHVEIEHHHLALELRESADVALTVGQTNRQSSYIPRHLL